MATADYKLFTPLRIDDDLELNNRVVLGPLTRARSDAHGLVNELNQLYYEQRAGAGLVITEATAVSEQGFGWYRAPAMYTPAHADAWRHVVDRVHRQHGTIFMQMWHMGRQGHSSFNAKRELVSASALRLEQGHTRNANGAAVPYETPRALETHELANVVDAYRQSAQLAKQAGFDGVEIHAANGYLIDQFLQSVTNQRTDAYGGSFENRSRLLIEVVEAIQTVYPATRIGVRLSPNGAFGGMGSPDNFAMFTYTMERLRAYDLAYVAILDGLGFGFHDKDQLMTAFDAKMAFRGRVLANNSYTRDIAEGVVRSGAADFVGFGRLFMANPDLAQRFQNDWPLATKPKYEMYWDPKKGAMGYTEFPAYEPEAGTTEKATE
ncbi:TPA: hypothetical protein N0F65_005064 [Lagenidium giganteum]|uniref:NADH:flavin oxidoreductase/NADH oxidase N-terminal domain-containing protein n=1 Tax=Lagenidium giganteum TaxID=4803 RepID=A0AAV2ZIC0_9STRA|nr:TPA: hypothetical protein N0F65_005064 [Lagenidium giganteum]